MRAKYIKGHHLAEMARYAGVSREYVIKLIKEERRYNTDVAKQIMSASKMLEKELKAADNKLRKHFGFPLNS